MRAIVRSLALVVILATPTLASAHAFPENSSPHVGATVNASPPQVRVWFDGKLEPVFSTLIVKNAADEKVSAGNGTLDPSDHALLETTVPKTLPAGPYTVYWSVVAHDGHHTAGHFTFAVK